MAATNYQDCSGTKPGKMGNTDGDLYLADLSRYSVKIESTKGVECQRIFFRFSTESRLRNISFCRRDKMLKTEMNTLKAPKVPILQKNQ